MLCQMQGCVREMAVTRLKRAQENLALTCNSLALDNKSALWTLMQVYSLTLRLSSQTSSCHPIVFSYPAHFLSKQLLSSCLAGERSQVLMLLEVRKCDDVTTELERGHCRSWEPLNINVNDSVGIRKWHSKAWRFGMRRGLRGTALVSILNLGMHCLYVRERFSGVSSHALGPQKGDQLPLTEISTYNKRLNTGHDGTCTYSQPWEGRRIT